MASNKILSQCSGPRDATLSLSSGERVGLWVNKDIFSSNGSLNKQQEFTDVDNTPLLTFQWPEEIPITMVTNWTLTVTSSSSERRREFAQSSAEVLGCNQWEMVQAVMESCYRNFGAYLLEVSFWNVRLGHRDTGSARRACDHTRLVTDDLKCLFDDAEYTFLDIMMEWDVSLLPGTQTPVQDSLTVMSQDLPFNHGITTDGPGSLLPCLSRRLTDGQQRERTADTLSEPQHSSTESVAMLQRILDGQRDTRKALNELKESSRQDAQAIKDLASETKQTNHLLQNVASETKQTNLLLQNLASETKQTNHLLQNVASETKQTNLLLQALVQNAGQFSHAGSDNETERASDLTRSSWDGMTNISDLNIDEKESDITEFRYTDRELFVSLEIEGEGINTVEELRQLERKEAPICPEHVKCIEDPLYQYISNPSEKSEEVTEESSKRRKEGLHTGNKKQNGASGRTSYHEPARNRATENPAPNSLRQTTSPQAFCQSRTTKEETESNLTEEDETPNPPVNMSKTRTHGSSLSTPDVRPKESTRTSRCRNRISGEASAIECDSAFESRRLDEVLAPACAPDPNPLTKARSYDTVLCLDTSESMLQGNAYQQMIEVTNRFIDGVEDMASDVEENIALVTFGGKADIVLHLTNNFSLVRQAVKNIEFGGSSPFYEAMVVCLAALDGKDDTVSVSGEYEVHPRIVFITDGHITESSNDPIDRVIDATNTRASFSRLMMDFNPKKDPSIPHPIVFVPVGSRTDWVFLNSMVELNGGQLIEPQNLTSVCNYFKIQETIGKVIVCMRKVDKQDISDQKIQNVVMALAPNINNQEMVVVTAGVNKELKNSNRCRGHDHPSSFDDVFEDAEEEEEEEDDVDKVPVWQWRDDWGNWRLYSRQEMQHLESAYKRKRNGTCVLQRGSKRVRILFQRKTERDMDKYTERDIQRLLMPEEDLRSVEVAEELMSGHWGEDGEEEAEEEDDEDKVPVWQWRDDWGNWRLYSRQEMQRLESAYKRKRNGTCVLQRGSKLVRILFQRKTERDIDKHTERDIQRLLMPEEDLRLMEVAEELMSGHWGEEGVLPEEDLSLMQVAEELMSGHWGEEGEEEEDDEGKVPVWQWRDDWGNWRLYSRQEMQHLESAYKRKRNGACVLQRGSKLVRILFQRKIEKDVDTLTERDIQRLLLPEEDLRLLEVAEELVSSQ